MKCVKAKMRHLGVLFALCLAILPLGVQAQMVNRVGHGVVGQMQMRLFNTLLHADLAEQFNFGSEFGFAIGEVTNAVDDF